jgi:spermidine/putrescine transport system permease protein
MKLIKQNLSKILLLAPSYGWLLLTVFVPMLIMLVFSFLSDVPLGARAENITWTLDNYRTYFSRAFYWTLTRKSLLTALYTTLACLLIAYPMAYIAARLMRGKWKTALFMLMIVPLWSNTLVHLYSWAIVLRDNGLLDNLLKAVGLTSGSLNILYSYPAVIIGLVHGYLPYMVLTIYVALDKLDQNLLDAAGSLGANRLQSFLRVTLPLSLPGVLAGVIMTFIPVMGSFVEPRILGGKEGTMIGTVIEDQFVQLFNWNFGAAVAFILLLMVLVLMGLSALVARRRRLLGGG